MYRFNEVKNAQRVEEITVGSIVTTYVGNAIVGSLDASPVWQIARVVEDSSVAWTVSTSIKFPDGDHKYSFIWSNRASLTYV